MKKSEKLAKDKLKEYDVQTTKKGGASTEYQPRSSKTTSIGNLADAIRTFRASK